MLRRVFTRFSGFMPAIVAAGLMIGLTGSEAKAGTIYWTDWQTSSNVNGFTGNGQITTPTATVGVTYHNDRGIAFYQTGAGGEPEVGVLTFGARHFIGREISIEPGALPWAAHFETILAFLKVATTENGYVIPNGDTFGPEDRSLSYRVLHCEPEEEGGVPLYRLVPLMHRACGFQSAEYVEPEWVVDDRMPPGDLMPDDDEAKAALANEWREKRSLAEGIGGRFEVRAKHSGPAGPQPPRPGFPLVRKVFGRKIT